VTQVGKDIRHIADRLKITAESIEDRKSWVQELNQQIHCLYDDIGDVETLAISFSKSTPTLFVMT
jgi:hypothetical protein